MFNKPRSRREGLPNRGRLLAALAASLLLLSPAVAAADSWWPWLRDQDKEPPIYPEIAVTPDWLSEHVSDAEVAIVDVRPEAAYLSGHVPGAISLHPDSLAAVKQIGAVLAQRGLKPNQRIVCYGDRSSFVALTRLFWLLELAGATEVSLLDGGFATWEATGGSQSTVPATLPPAQWDAPFAAGRLATADSILANFGTKGHEILDARAAGFGPTQSAMSSGGCIWRQGHIPSALPVDFTAYLKDEGSFLSPKEIRDRIRLIGPRKSTYVDMDAQFIVYDDGSSGAGLLGYLLLRMAGQDKVQYYPGGWHEWSSTVTRPFIRVLAAEDVLKLLESEPATMRTDQPPRGFAFFDVRHSIDHGNGHIPGAVNVLSSQFADSLESVLARCWPGFDRTKSAAVVYCYGADCIRSRNCSTQLARAGFLRPEWFYGGIAEWKRKGYLVVKPQTP